jgi:hypothetical protein
VRQPDAPTDPAMERHVTAPASHRPRGGRASVAGLTSVLVLMLIPSAARADRPACSGVRSAGSWTTIQVPDDPVPATQAERATYTDVALMAVDVGAPDVLLATDHARKHVYRSSNGGCSWQTVLDLGQSFTGLDATLISQRPYFVDALWAGRTRAGQHLDYAVLVDPNDEDLMGFTFGLGSVALKAMPMYVAVSSDRGTHWRLAAPSADVTRIPDPALHPPCSSVHLVPWQHDPNTVYADCGVNNYGVFNALYVSRDAGAHWHEAARAGLPRTYGANSGLAVDPVDARSVWASGPVSRGDTTYATAWHSVDGGETWKPQGPVGKKLIDANHACWSVLIETWRPTPTGPTWIDMWAPAGLYQSTNGGRTWTWLTVPTGVNEQLDIEGVVPIATARPRLFVIAGLPQRPHNGDTALEPNAGLTQHDGHVSRVWTSPRTKVWSARPAPTIVPQVATSVLHWVTGDTPVPGSIYMMSTTHGAGTTYTNEILRYRGPIA